MNRSLPALLFLVAAPLAVRADDTASSVTALDALDRRGYLTPAFTSAARALIDAKKAQRDARTDEATLRNSIPELTQTAQDEEAKVAALQVELDRYAHPDETDLAALRDAMKNPMTQLDEQQALAQAYIWTYPTSPHAPEVQQDLAQIQKAIADRAQAEKDADAAKMAAQIKLLERVKARDLSLEEWRVFLQDKSQTEVTEYLGHPSETTPDYWTYDGTWTVDPATKQKAGLQLTFNGGRVLAVALVPLAKTPAASTSE